MSAKNQTFGQKEMLAYYNKFKTESKSLGACLRNMYNSGFFPSEWLPILENREASPVYKHLLKTVRQTTRYDKAKKVSVKTGNYSTYYIYQHFTNTKKLAAALEVVKLYQGKVIETPSNTKETAKAK